MTHSVGTSGIGRTGSAFLQRQPDAQSAIDAADRLALPFQHGGISTKKLAQSSRTDRKNHRTDEPQQDKKDPKDRQLKHDRSVFGRHELREEREKKERGFRVQHL